MSDERYIPTPTETEADEMRRKAFLSIRIERLWLRVLKLEKEMAERPPS